MFRPSPAEIDDVSERIREARSVPAAATLMNAAVVAMLLSVAAFCTRSVPLRNRNGLEPKSKELPLSVRSPGPVLLNAVASAPAEVMVPVRVTPAGFCTLNPPPPTSTLIGWVKVIGAEPLNWRLPVFRPIGPDPT
jgi:hypothetical protein